jgi:hypothetical protein
MEQDRRNLRSQCAKPEISCDGPKASLASSPAAGCHERSSRVGLPPAGPADSLTYEDANLTQCIVMLITVFIALIFLHSLVSARLERTGVTAPIVFAAAGMFTYLAVPESRDHQVNQGLFLNVAGIGLGVLLFTDPSRTDLRVRKNTRNLPVRLLSTADLYSLPK